MADVFPIAGAAIVREDAREKVALLRGPAADHRLDAERAPGAHPQILTNASPRLPIGMLKQARQRHLLRVSRGADAKRRVPGHGGMPMRARSALCAARIREGIASAAAGAGCRGRTRAASTAMANIERNEPPPGG